MSMPPQHLYQRSETTGTCQVCDYAEPYAGNCSSCGNWGHRAIHCTKEGAKMVDPVLMWLRDYVAMMKGCVPTLRDSMLDKTIERVVEVEIYLRDAKKERGPRCSLQNSPRCEIFPQCPCGQVNTARTNYG